MSRTAKNPSPLLQAAEAFAEQLQRFEDASETLQRSPMSSGKHLERVAETLREVTSIDEQLGEHVRVLVQVISEVRDRQQKQAEGVLQRAKELQRRTEEFQTLQQKYAALGN